MRSKFPLALPSGVALTCAAAFTGLPAAAQTTTLAPELTQARLEVQKIAANLKATLIIQHDARGVGKLPVWPSVAK